MNPDKYYDEATGNFKVGKFIIWFFGIVILISILGYVGGWFGEAAQVAREEFGPRAMLEKYEWFKDVAAQLDKKGADIKVYQANVTQMTEDYEGTKRIDWDRTDKEQFNTWRMEVAGIKASYNSLAADYNSGMAKFNYSFANVGTLPKGATEPLPREFKSYLEN